MPTYTARFRVQSGEAATRGELMKMITITLLGGMLLGAGTARAVIVTETFSGIIFSGEDPNGRFGTPTSPFSGLQGKTLTIKYRIDLGAGGISSNDGTIAEYKGGSAYSTPTVAKVIVSVDEISSV